MSNLKIAYLRQGSLGLAGTLRNAEHHARTLLPIINHLAQKITGSEPNFTWKQGHNVHLFESFDGRQFVLRPWSQKSRGYLGIQLFLRTSRSKEVFLRYLHKDSSFEQIDQFADFLISLAETPPFHEVMRSEDFAALKPTIDSSTPIVVR